jgi:hypothetical protein
MSSLRSFRCPSPRPVPRALVGAVVSVLLAAACGEPPPELAVSTESRPSAAPQVVAFDPPNGAADVDPARGTITVTFDREMDRQGWAWVIENPATAPETGESRFDPTGRANSVDVQLEPGRTYVVWVNSPEYPYFRDPSGVPATPVRWTFSTRGVAPAGASGDFAPIAAHAAGPPRIVAFDPPNGATGVDAATSELRVTFDRVMSEGWSWVTEGQDFFPETTGEAFMTADRRTAILPVRLASGRRYVVWLNSQQFRYFRDLSGVELEPVRWTFATAPAP